MQGTTISSKSREELINLHEIVYNPGKNIESFFSNKCKELLSEIYRGKSVFLFDSEFSALIIGLKSIEIQATDEVLVSECSPPLLKLAIQSIGAIAIEIPVDKKTMSLSLQGLESRLNEKSKAIVVDVFHGIPPEIDELVYFSARHGLSLFEYASDGLGSTYKYNPLGCFGNIGLIGFNPLQSPHPLGCFLVVNDIRLLDRMEELNLQNSTLWLSELKAGILLPNLHEIDNLKDIRKQIWTNYWNVLQVFEEEGRFFILGSDSQDSHNYSGFTLFFENVHSGKNLYDYLLNNKIETQFYAKGIYSLVDLPFHDQLHEEEILHICLVVGEYFTGDEPLEGLLDIRQSFLDNLDI